MITIGNAAGTLPLHRLDLVEHVAPSAATHITVGPFRVNKWAGNGDKGTYYSHDGWSLNALGLPAKDDCHEACWNIRAATLIAHRHEKNLRTTVVGNSPREYAFLAALAFAFGADGVEYNFGCPNVWGEDGQQKPIPSYHPPLMIEILNQTRQVLSRGQGVELKISPVEDALLQDIASIYKQYDDIVRGIVAVNTIPNQGRIQEDGFTHALSFGNGNHIGGLAGDPARPEAVRVLSTLRRILPHWANLTGVGGISTGEHALELLEAGANRGIQIGTAYYNNTDPGIFGDILEQLAALPAAQKYLQAA